MKVETEDDIRGDRWSLKIVRDPEITSAKRQKNRVRSSIQTVRRIVNEGSQVRDKNPSECKADERQVPSQHEKVASCPLDWSSSSWWQLRFNNLQASLTSSITGYSHDVHSGDINNEDNKIANTVSGHSQLALFKVRHIDVRHKSGQDGSIHTNIASICGQFLTLIASLLALLYLLNFLQRKMTNLFTKILSGVNANAGMQERHRRSSSTSSGLANRARSSLTSSSAAAAVPTAEVSSLELIAQSRFSRSSLCLPTVATQYSENILQSPVQMPQSQPQKLHAQDKSTTSNQHSGHNRRSSRSSIHSLFSALTGVISHSSSSPAQTTTNNGRSIIAKNKEDTMILASASPTIVAKESGDGTGSTPVSMVPSVSSHSAGSPITPSPGTGSGGAVSPLVATALGGAAAVSELSPNEAAELALADQNLFDKVRNPYGFPTNLSMSNVLALAAAAALEPISAPGTGASVTTKATAATTGNVFQMPSVATQQYGNVPALSGLSPVVIGTIAQQQQSSASGTHGPLSSSTTIKQAGSGPVSPATAVNGLPQSSRRASNAVLDCNGKRMEIIKLTELLLNALNQGDYDTYTRLCDPHMTSFEPENLGHLVDNMEYRRLCVDQARQMQIYQHIQRQTAGQGLGVTGQTAATNQRQQAIAVAAASAAAAAAISAVSGESAATLGTSVSSKQQFEQRVQQVAIAAATAATQTTFAGLSLRDESGQVGAVAHTTPTANATANANAQELNFSLQQNSLAAHSASSFSSSCASTLKQYSLVLNPNVHLMGEGAASIAYTKLSHLINLVTGQLCGSEQSEETRIWHKRDGKTWTCVHLHRSMVDGRVGNLAGPQTSLSLLRSVAQQQQISALVSLQQGGQQAQSSVPVISLNNAAGRHQQQQQQQ